jgi:hypothetical protein
VALGQEMKNNARKMKIRTSKILRKPEIGRDDRETLKSLKRKGTCHKIHHKWEGQSTTNQSAYQRAFPLFFKKNGHWT